MGISTQSTDRLLSYFLLVFVLSIPFWILGAGGRKLTQVIPVNLPISALMFVCPLIAALIMTLIDAKSIGAKKLLKSAVDYKRPSRKIWFLPSIFLMPIILALSYVTINFIGPSLPKPQFSIQVVEIAAVFFLVFFVSAFGEEVGWSGYATDRMENRWTALISGLILGSVWATWHAIPYFEAGNTIEWIIWQCLFTIGARVIIVWLYNNTQKSTFVAILFHTMINVSTFLFPVYGSYYNPEVTAIITIMIAAIITFLWGPRTLSNFRYAKHSLSMKTAE